ncbi:putative G-protein coupled receptor 25 [Brachyhypopomus gauderio]|uniref:putative G-protein coupled receptor 25 n=1 Tax=Brachyhypopomus gauderio TaxID=698409 RepID=UPI0040419ACB
MDGPTEVFYYYDYNSSSITEPPGFQSTVDPQLLSMSHVYLPVLYFVIFFAGVSGNLFVLVVIGNRHKRRGRLVDTFVLNLAFADLVFVFTLPLWAISAGLHNQWPFGNALCKFSSYVISVNRFSNIFFLTCMSVDRYLAVVRLLESHLLRSSKCVRFTCAAVWVTSLVLGTPSLVYRELRRSGDHSSCLEDLNSSFFQAVVLLTILLTFMLPMLVIVLCYGSIISKLREHSTMGNLRPSVRCRHSLKIVFTIITAFLVSWLPYNVFKSIQVISKMSNTDMQEDVESSLGGGLIISSCLAFVNSCVNPAIYLFLDKHFRHSAAAICVSCLGQGDQQSYFPSNSISTNSESVGSTASRGRLFSLTSKS